MKKAVIIAVSLVILLTGDVFGGRRRPDADAMPDSTIMKTALEAVGAAAIRNIYKGYPTANEYYIIQCIDITTALIGVDYSYLYYVRLNTNVGTTTADYSGIMAASADGLYATTLTLPSAIYLDGAVVDSFEVDFKNNDGESDLFNWSILIYKYSF